MNIEKLNELGRIIDEMGARSENSGRVETLGDILWAVRKGKELDSCQEVWEEILNRFEELNRAANTENTIKLGPADPFPRALVANITYLVSDCLEVAAQRELHAEVRLGLIRFAWQICMAWGAVLDGDCDNLKEHIEMEAVGRDMFPLP